MKKDRRKISEYEMEEKLFGVLIKSGGMACRQVPLSQKRIDIVTYDQDVVTAIELKIHDWKSGLRQAFVNMIACNVSYIAVWHEHSNFLRHSAHVFSDAGVGVLIVEDDFSTTIAVEAKKRSSKMVNKVARAKVKAYMYQNVV